MNRQQYFNKICTLLYLHDSIEYCRISPSCGELFLSEINRTRLNTMSIITPDSSFREENNAYLMQLDIKADYLLVLHSKLQEIKEEYDKSNPEHLDYLGGEYRREIIQGNKDNEIYS